LKIRHPQCILRGNSTSRRKSGSQGGFGVKLRI
jgi:hypothetical protein